MNTTRLTRQIRAPRERVYRALLDAEAVLQWMVPDQMTSRIHSFDAREGGTFRISLNMTRPRRLARRAHKLTRSTAGSSSSCPTHRSSQAVEFESKDPAMAGEMRITYTLADADGGTNLVGVHENLPRGVSPADNQLGWRMSIDQLAELVEEDH